MPPEGMSPGALVRQQRFVCVAERARLVRSRSGYYPSSLWLDTMLKFGRAVLRCVGSLWAMPKPHTPLSGFFLFMPPRQ